MPSTIYNSAAFPKPGRVPRRLRLMAVIASSAGLLVGYNTAVISGVLPSLRMTWVLDDGTESLIVGALLVGACIGALIGGRLADELGRRDVIMATAAVFSLATFASSLSPTPRELIAARLLIGFAVGVVSVAAPLYLAEIAPTVSRGAMVSWYQLAITLGILLAYTIDDLIGISPQAWREMFVGCSGVAMLLGLAMAFMPDSPRWMVAQDDEQEAHSILERLGVYDPDASIKEFRSGLDDEPDQTLQQLSRPLASSPITIGICLFFFQQFGGINALIYYAPALLGRAGFAENHEALFTTVGIGVANVLATVLSIRLIDRVGRRTLLLWSLAGMVVSLVLLSTADLAMLESLLPGVARYFVMICLFSYICSFAIGMGPVCWVMIAEIYPLRIRGTAMSIAALAHWGFDLLISTSFALLSNHVNWETLGLTYAAFAALGFVWTRKYLPETRGRSLEDIQRDWQASLAAQRQPA